ncbi:MAG: Uma2 family endonuclease [Cyanobacteriota bacterium]|nr:Uma2 family endonuclease [Cyanobacteriota bacterium]
MTARLIIENKPVTERQFILPCRHDWQQFKAIQAAMENVPGLKISYLDGVVEFLTIGEEHETLKTIICLLLGLYFLEKNIEFTPVGSATREHHTKKVSFDPDESYYLGEKKAHPDLAIEVAITCGGKAKLKKYKRFGIAEVWFWENNQLSVYHFRGEEYEQVSRSELLSELDLELLARCVKMPTQLEAMREFTKGIRKQ